MKSCWGRYCTLMFMIVVFVATSNSALGESVVNDTSHEVNSSDRLQPSKYPLAELRKSVFSIDWEASDETLKIFKQEINGLCTLYKDNPLAVMYLQILDKFGEYIENNPGKNNPKTLRIMKRIFLRLDEIVHEGETLETNVEKYRFSGQRTISHTHVPVASTDAMTRAVEEIKEYVHAEVKKLREEIHELHK